MKTLKDYLEIRFDEKGFYAFFDSEKFFEDALKEEIDLENPAEYSFYSVITDAIDFEKQGLALDDGGYCKELKHVLSLAKTRLENSLDQIDRFIESGYFR